MATDTGWTPRFGQARPGAVGLPGSLLAPGWSRSVMVTTDHPAPASGAVLPKAQMILTRANYGSFSGSKAFGPAE